MRFYLLTFLFFFLTSAQAQWSRCDKYWKLKPGDVGRKWTVKTDCHPLAGYPKQFGDTNIIVTYTRKWSQLSTKTKNAVKPVLEKSLAETFKTYNKFAKLPTVIVIILTTDVDGLTTAATSNPYEKKSPFQIQMYQRWTTEATTNVPRALFAVAHELYHCVQDMKMGNARDPEYIRDGTANYFANVVFPNSNTEWPGKKFSGAEYDPAVPLYAHDGQSAYAASVFFQSMGNHWNLHSMNDWVLNTPIGFSGTAERQRLSELGNFVETFFTFAQEFALQSIEDTSGVMIPTIPEIPPKPVSIKMSTGAASTTGTATLTTTPFTISVFKITVKTGQTVNIYSSANSYQRVAYRKPGVKDWVDMPTDATSGKPHDLPCKKGDTPATFIVLFISSKNVKTDQVKIMVKYSRPKQCGGRTGFVHYPLFNPKTSGGYCPEGTHMSKTAIWCCPDGLELDEEVANQVSICCPPDFINSLNNTVSGILVLKNGYPNPGTSPSTGCLANAWVGQFSVQAIDFNILIISISVFLAVQRQQFLSDSSRTMTGIVCILPWIPGTITSFIGLGLSIYGPVSGNWCWIQSQHLGLRYGLTHAWRIAIFLATVSIYTFIYIKLRRLFSSLKVDLSSSAAGQNTGGNRSRAEPDTAEPSDSRRIWITTTVESSYELQSRPALKENQDNDGSNSGKAQWSTSSIHQPPPTEVPYTDTTPQSSNNVEPSTNSPASPNLKRMLLLNGYPIAYIILWIPGMANRLAESVGTSPQWLTSLQACTQFVGMVNALTYGFTEQMQRAIQMWMKRRSFRTLDIE
ncbi:hypothetical protein CDV31_006987 [Fusarium ambrosium]|uniref:G protein-coupled receptor GPR1/2/3 C-terminal domain-containing protein n=1 Tax=Fusarium ambrosium TaxID=131363 RepID=A0A428UA60_9HYPO|nr:hypothetical protein CDV31_006987 [Fusarium ambrosium]